MKLIVRTFLVLGVLLSFSCTTLDEEVRTDVTLAEGVPGGKVVETSTVRATVTGIDAAKRGVTFVTPKGNKFSTKAGAEVENFDQIQIGDQLTVSVAEEVVIRMAKPGEKLEEFGTLTAELAPLGSKPGMNSVETNQVVAVVTSVNMKRRKATLTFADGQSKKFKVRPDIDLSRYKQGDRVVIAITETVAVSLKKPE